MSDFPYEPEPSLGEEPDLEELPPWLISGSDLLAQPDPGPTPWLVENLIVDQALVAAVGLWKTTKSLAMLEIAISIVTGRSAFGTLAIPKPGPVVFVIEESGRDALWRRLDSLSRGRAIRREELGDLHLATNARVKLDDESWQAKLLALGETLHPRLFVFDPLARMKAPARDENSQGEMAVVLEFLRRLRDESGAAVSFVHHLGKIGGTMRGSSDLESAWETRLSWTREGGDVDLTSEHREAETSPTLRYRLSWNAETRSLRLVAAEGIPRLGDRILSHIRENGAGRAEGIARALETRRSDVERVLDELAQEGKVQCGPSGRRDKAGRIIHDKAWNLSTQAGLWPVPDSRTTQDDLPMSECESSQTPTPKGVWGSGQPTDGSKRSGH